MKRWLRGAVHTFETNPQWQYKFHLVMMLVWIFNFVVGTVVVLVFPSLWLAVGVYYVFALSIYANWTSDFTAVSATIAAMHSQELLEQIAAAEEVLDSAQPQ